MYDLGSLCKTIRSYINPGFSSFADKGISKRVNEFQFLIPNALFKAFKSSISDVVSSNVTITILVCRWNIISLALSPLANVRY